MTPPDFERNKADHTAFAVRVARNSYASQRTF
jgi:hypothetical protein